MHAIEAADERRLAASGRTDERGGLLGGDVQVDVQQGMVGAIPCIEILHLNSDAHLIRPFQDAARGHIAHQRNRYDDERDEDQRASPGEACHSS